MDTTTAVVAAGVIVTVGQWSKKDGHISIKLVVGMMVLAIMLSGLSAVNEKLAQQFATLILVGVVFTYAIPITQKLGFSK
jgi:hypothetical protein